MSLAPHSDEKGTYSRKDIGGRAGEAMLEAGRVDYEGVAALSLRGGLVRETVEAVRSDLAELLACPAPTIAVDLTEVTHIDAAGISALLDVVERLRTHRRLTVICPTGGVRRVLDLMGLCSSQRCIVVGDRSAVRTRQSD